MRLWSTRVDVKPRFRLDSLRYQAQADRTMDRLKREEISAMSRERLEKLLIDGEPDTPKAIYAHQILARRQADEIVRHQLEHTQRLDAQAEYLRTISAQLRKSEFTTWTFWLVVLSIIIAALAWLFPQQPTPVNSKPSSVPAYDQFMKGESSVIEITPNSSGSSPVE